MSDIELVIKIPKDSYEATCNGCMLPPDVENVVNAIKNGTPLPEGHGKIGDLDELYSIFRKNCDAYNIDNLSFISDIDMNFDLAPTIIEADKESDSE